MGVPFLPSLALVAGALLHVMSFAAAAAAAAVVVVVFATFVLRGDSLASVHGRCHVTLLARWRQLDQVVLLEVQLQDGVLDGGEDETNVFRVCKDRKVSKVVDQRMVFRVKVGG